MLVEQYQVLGYWFLYLAAMGIGLELMATRLPGFKLSKETLLRAFMAFLKSWEFGFLVGAFGILVVKGVIGDIITLFAIGYAVPDLPQSFVNRYGKTLMALVKLAGLMVSPWIVTALEILEQLKANQSAPKKEAYEVNVRPAESKEESEPQFPSMLTPDTEKLEWKEPDYKPKE